MRGPRSWLQARSSSLCFSSRSAISTFGGAGDFFSAGIGFKFLRDRGPAEFVSSLELDGEIRDVGDELMLSIAVHVLSEIKHLPVLSLSSYLHAAHSTEPLAGTNGLPAFAAPLVPIGLMSENFNLLCPISLAAHLVYRQTKADLYRC